MVVGISCPQSPLIYIEKWLCMQKNGAEHVAAVHIITGDDSAVLF